MSLMVEVYYQLPLAEELASLITDKVAKSHGKVTFKEKSGPNAECLTIEFADSTAAESGARELRATGLHVEGPVTYGND